MHFLRFLLDDVGITEKKDIGIPKKRWQHTSKKDDNILSKNDNLVSNTIY